MPLRFENSLIGAAMVWGIVPTGFETFAQEEIPSLVQRLVNILHDQITGIEAEAI